jgi:hypothetical protein
MLDISVQDSGVRAQELLELLARHPYNVTTNTPLDSAHRACLRVTFVFHLTLLCALIGYLVSHVLTSKDVAQETHMPEYGHSCTPNTSKYRQCRCRCRCTCWYPVFVRETRPETRKIPALQAPIPAPIPAHSNASFCDLFAFYFT